MSATADLPPTIFTLVPVRRPVGNNATRLGVCRSVIDNTDYRLIGPAVGDVFPDFELSDADGKPIRLHGWRAGRRALVVFYRSAAW